MIPTKEKELQRVVGFDHEERQATIDNSNLVGKECKENATIQWLWLMTTGFSWRYDAAADKLLLIFLWADEIERLFRQTVLMVQRESIEK